MLKRIISRGGVWQGVTGAPEGDEIIAEGAKRELYEESGWVNIEQIELPAP